MSATRDLLTGLQATLAATTTVPGTIGALPYDADRYWAVSYTNAGTDPYARWAQGVLILQTRGAVGVPLDADDIADPLAAALTALTGVTFGTATVNTVTHRGASRGLDSSKRSVRADRFDLDLDYQA